MKKFAAAREMVAAFLNGRAHPRRADQIVGDALQWAPCTEQPPEIRGLRLTTPSNAPKGSKVIILYGRQENGQFEMMLAETDQGEVWFTLGDQKVHCLPGSGLDLAFLARAIAAIERQAVTTQCWMVAALLAFIEGVGWQMPLIPKETCQRICAVLEATGHAAAA